MGQWEGKNEMNRLAIAIAAFLVQDLCAADLTGHWVANQPGPGGQGREVSLWLKSGADQLSTRDGILLHMPAFGGRGGRRGAPSGPGGAQTELLAKRVSTEKPKPLPPPPPKIRLAPAPNVPYNRLAKTPPMGWNSWNQFRAQVSDKLVRETADAMVRNGMKDAGYVYINIDDTWQGKRDEQGVLQPNARFPDMKALADYIHGKGLKFGIYSSPGLKTCAGYEGSFRHEEQDARTFAQWGVDYLKYDLCSARTVYDLASMPAVFAKMGLALQASGRPMVYSFSAALPKAAEWAFAAGGNLLRTGSFGDSYDSMATDGFDHQRGLENFAGPGHWNDPGVLHIGQGGMNDTESRTHFTLWCLLAAPLLAGNDLRNVPPAILEILTNKEAIDVDQDPLGAQATRVMKEGNLEIWTKPLAKGGYAVGLFNRGAAPARMILVPGDLGMKYLPQVRDLWAHEDQPDSDVYIADMPAHGVVLLKVTGYLSGRAMPRKSIRDYATQGEETLKRWLRHEIKRSERELGG